MTTFLIPFEYSGICRIDAPTPEEAREMFNTMRASELVGHAEFWCDDRTMTEQEYAEAIREVKEGPAPTERAGSGPTVAGALAGADAGSS